MRVVNAENKTTQQVLDELFSVDGAVESPMAVPVQSLDPLKTPETMPLAGVKPGLAQQEPG